MSVFRTVYIDGRSTTRNATTFKLSGSGKPLLLAWAPSRPRKGEKLNCLKLDPRIGMDNINCYTKLTALCETESEFEL